MRAPPFLLSLVALFLGCASRPPIDRTAVGQGTGFYCYEQTNMHEAFFCHRDQKACESEASGSKYSSDCKATAHATCFTFRGGATKSMHCFGTKKQCERDARAYVERATEVSACEEI